MSRSSKAYGSEGGFGIPIDLPPGDYTLKDGQVISASGPASFTLPSGIVSDVGVIIHCKSGILTVLTQSPDTITPTGLDTLTQDQSIQYSPVSTGWVVI